jgi:twinkle protein
MTVDFRDINVNEELAQAETSEMLCPTDLVERVAARRASQKSGINLPWSKLDGLFALRPGEMVLMGGYTGHFKSTITTQIGLEAMRQGYNVGIASLELLAEDVLEQYAEMAACNSEPPLDFVKGFAGWCSDKLHIYDRVDAIKPSEAIQMTIAFAKYKRCKLVILDALMMMGVCDDLERERDFTQTLAAVAKRFGICVLLVHHVRKPQGDGGEQRIPGKYDFIGSSHLANIAASILIVWHDKRKSAKAALIAQGMQVEDFDDTKADLVVKVAKQRYAKYEGSVGLWQHRRCRAFCSTRDRRLNPVEFGRVAA